MKRKLIVTTILTLTLLVPGCAGNGESIINKPDATPAPQQNQVLDMNRVVDNLKFLKDADKASLEAEADALSEKADFDFVIFTEADLAGKTENERAYDFFYEGGYGIGKNRDGIMLFRCKNESNNSVFVLRNGSATSSISDEYMGIMYDRIIDKIKAGDEAGAYRTFVAVAYEAVNYYKNTGSALDKPSEIVAEPTPEATATPEPEATATPEPTPEPTATPEPTPEPTATSTPTPVPTATNTPKPVATATPKVEKDTNGPTVSAKTYKVDSSSISVYENVKVSVKIEDNSGVAEAYVVYMNALSEKETVVELNYNSKTKLYEGYFGVYSQMDATPWFIDYIYAKDKKGNETKLCNTALAFNATGADLSEGDIYVTGMDY